MYNNFYYPLKRTKENEFFLPAIEKAANELFSEPIEALKYRNFNLFNETGSRVEYELEYMKHRKMLCAFSVMALLNEDEKWLLKLCDILWAICDEYTWALPAHINTENSGDEISEFIDLFAAETAFYISEIYHILKDVLPAPVKNRIEFELKRRIVKPFLEKHPSYGPSNWSGVCGCGVGCTFIYLGLDEEFKLAKKYILNNMREFLDSYNHDGCCLEGTLYWCYGFSYFCYFAELLRQYTNNEIDYFKDEKVKNIAHFGQNVYLRENYIVPFSDSPHTDKYNSGFLWFLASKYDGINVPDIKYASTFGDDVRYRLAGLIRNLYWTKSASENRTEDKSYIFYPDAQWYINKKNTYCFAAKGGHNDEPHNHNDIGSFLVFDDGKYILDDPGWPIYDKNYFSDKRYENMCASSLGHSVPIINGQEQSPGQEYTSEILCATENTFEIQMAKAYNIPSLKSLIRKFELSDNSFSLTDLTDGEIAEFTERFSTGIKPEIKGDKVIISNYELSCENDAKISISSFNLTPRFSGLDGAEDTLITQYLIDFKLKDFKKVKFNLKKSEG